MSDKSTRSREREGELDLPAILRAASDRRRRLGLIRLCAKLGHEEAERWRQELGLREIAKAPSKPSLSLSRSRLECWVIEIAARAVALKRREGVPIDTLALEAVQGSLSLRGLTLTTPSQPSRSHLEETLSKLTQLEAELRPEAELEAGQPSGEETAAVTRARERLDSVYLGLAALEAALGEEDRVFLCLSAAQAERELVGDAWWFPFQANADAILEANAAEEAEEVWLLTHLRERYLWPEVIRR